jgi:hypothetical protein
MRIILLVMLSALGFGQLQPAVALERIAAPAAASVYFIGLADGDVVPPEFVVRFGLRGLGVAPAGIDVPDTGHHHLLINLPELPPLNRPLPASEQVVHFGGGQTEAAITLAPGVYTLQLLLGDYRHVPHDPPVISELITITVEAP